MDLLALLFQAAFIGVAVGVIVAVARSMRAEGAPVGPDDDERARAAALGRAVAAAFLLMSFGTAAVVLALGVVADDLPRAIQALSRQIGWLLLVLGGLHRGASMLSARLIGATLNAPSSAEALDTQPWPGSRGEAKHGPLAALRTALWTVVIVVAVVALQPVVLDLPGSPLLGVAAIGACVAVGQLAIDVAGRALRGVGALDAPAMRSFQLVSHGAVALSCGLGTLPADGVHALDDAAVRIGVVLLALGAVTAAALIARARSPRPEMA